MREPRLVTAMLALAASILMACGSEPVSSSLEEARLLRQSGRYVQSTNLYEDVIASGDSQPQVLLEYAEVALLAAQSERTTILREKARNALLQLTVDSTVVQPLEFGDLWRRLGWEMARNNDSLQAFDCFDRALENGLTDMFEEEWLFRGAFAGYHLEQLLKLPDSLVGTVSGDSMLALAAEGYLVELDRIPLPRTDLRESVLIARMHLLPFTSRTSEELYVLTELDRLGGIDPGMKLRRIQLLLEVATEDIEMNRTTMAREKLMEVWESDFAGERVEAAVMLGLMAEEEADPTNALFWYRRACNAAPGSTSPASVMARAKRDSLMYNGLE